MFDIALVGTVYMCSTGEWLFKHNKTDLEYVIISSDDAISSLQVGDSVEATVCNSKGEVKILKHKG